VNDVDIGQQFFGYDNEEAG